MAIKVTLRQKEISKNRKSLYLDFYPAIPNSKTGELTRREFLGLYIPSPIKIKKQKDKNGNEKSIPVYDNNTSKNNLIETDIENTLRLAEQIRQKRDKQLNGNEALTDLEKRLLEKDKAEQIEKRRLEEMDFLAYFKKLGESRKGSTQQGWISAFNYLESFSDGRLKFADLNQKLLEEFKTYLLSAKSKKSEKKILSQNSAASYFNKVKASLKQAYKEGALKTDLNSRIKPIKEEETRKEFLSLEELNILLKTPFDLDVMKRAALFSAITGMAFQEIKNMIWSDISYTEGEGYLILTKRQKSGRDNYLPISEQAYNLTGGNKNLNEMPQGASVFEGLDYSDYNNRRLHQWIKSAGIKKHITFHCFRHSYSVLQLMSGTEIYTLSKMLGHKNVKTTQVYAKIVDETKREAANKVKLDF